MTPSTSSSGHETDAAAQGRIAVMEGHYGEEIQFAAIQARTQELVRLAFDFYTFVPASGASVIGGGQPLICSRS